MDQTAIEALVARVVAELAREGLTPNPGSAPGTTPVDAATDGVTIDLPDAGTVEARRTLRVENPVDPEGLANLCSTTTARLGVGRAGARPKTAVQLRFLADHAVTQEAIYGVVDQTVLDELGLFTGTTQVDDREEYLLRPDLGRLLSEEARATVDKQCVKNPDVQICIGDGLSATAIDHNLRAIYPVITEGLKAAGLTVGTPFFIRNARVGVMNDVNRIIGAKTLGLLIGERPGLVISDAISAYMGYDPQPGKSDADRDLICVITSNGGTQPLEAGAYVVEFVKKMLAHGASGVRLRELAGS